MKSYLALAWKELKAQKITAILILVAVIMSTIMTTVIGQSIGILQSMRIQQAAGLNGNRYATFHQLGKEQAQKLHEDDRLRSLCQCGDHGILRGGKGHTGGGFLRR